ncbi:MAG: cell wall hydrolase, partial [Clostridia bacterium]|nr:cell wall hydrolase [Clostridia bacterium]
AAADAAVPAPAPATVTAPSTAPAAPPTPVRVLFDGRVDALGAIAVQVQGTTFVPVRPFLERCGARVYWDDVSVSVRAFRGTDLALTLQGGRPAMDVNGRPLPLPAPPFLWNGQFYAPLRPLAEVLDVGMTWRAETAWVELTTPGHVATAARRPLPGAVSAEERDLLARVINAEAYGEPYEGKVAVGAVVVNRWLQGFAQTLRDVLTAPRQFTVVANQKIRELPLHPDAIRAAEEALAGVDPTGGALYFGSVNSDSPFWRKLRPLKRIGNHVFYAR